MIPAATVNAVYGSLAEAEAALDAAKQLADIVNTVAVQRGARAVRAQLEHAAREVSAPTRVAVVGERSRGKSKLINSLVGTRLPVEVDVATNVFVEVTAPPAGAPGDDPPVTVHMLDGSAFTGDLGTLHEHATEQGNPGNRRGVSHVEVRHRHPLLEGGLKLDDTPGTGGLEGAHAVAASQAVAQADGVVMVLDARRPVTDVEIDFLCSAAAEHRHVTVVFNKADGATDIAEMITFARGALERRAPALADAPMVAVSALMAVEAADLGDSEEAAPLAKASNIEALVAALREGPVAAVRRARTRSLLAQVAYALDDLARPDHAALVVLDGHTDARSALVSARDTLDRLRVASARVEVAHRMLLVERDADATLRQRLALLRDQLSDRIEQRRDANPEALRDTCTLELQQIWADTCARLDERAAVAVVGAATTLGIDSEPDIEIGPEHAHAVAPLVDAPAPPRAVPGRERWARFALAGVSVVIATATASPYIALAGVGALADRELLRMRASGRQQALVYVDRVLRDATTRLVELLRARAELWQVTAIAALEPLHRARLESAQAAVAALSEDADPAGPRKRLASYDALRSYLVHLQQRLEVNEGAPA
jgi:hypothetical protein